MEGRRREEGKGERVKQGGEGGGGGEGSKREGGECYFVKVQVFIHSCKICVKHS